MARRSRDRRGGGPRPGVARRQLSAVPGPHSGVEMEEEEVHCVRCGSADTLVERGDEGPLKRGRCLRCDKSFQATPCPVCGSFRIEGSYGISGVRFTTL